MTYLIGFLVSGIAFLSFIVWKSKQDVQKARIESLEAITAEKKQEDAKVLAAAKIITGNAKEEYEKAMANLPSDYKPPGSSGNVS